MIRNNQQVNWFSAKKVAVKLIRSTMKDRKWDAIEKGWKHGLLEIKNKLEMFGSLYFDEISPTKNWKNGKESI